jgi:hypothetical protein
MVNLYGLISSHSSYPTRVFDHAKYCSDSGGTVRWKDAAAKLVLLFMDEGALAPVSVRRGLNESARAYISRLEDIAPSPTSPEGLPGLASPHAESAVPAYSLPFGHSERHSVTSSPLKSPAAAAASAAAASSSSRSTLAIRLPSSSGADQSDELALSTCLNLVDMALYSSHVWDKELFQELSLRLSRYFNILNTAKIQEATRHHPPLSAVPLDVKDSKPASAGSASVAGLSGMFQTLSAVAGKAFRRQPRKD